MIDKLSIDNKLGDLIKNVSILEGLKNISIHDLKKSPKDQWSIFYGLQISIQIVIDIGNHILAELKESRIEEYADVIDKLGERQIIPEDFARRIRGITGLRNLLVHEYGVIRIEKIYDMLQNNLSDFTEFHDYIQNYITE
jgi:uncharacterized protein YutE (UPF0331/DUF86 family)